MYLSGGGRCRNKSDDVSILLEKKNTDQEFKFGKCSAEMLGIRS